MIQRQTREGEGWLLFSSPQASERKAQVAVVAKLLENLVVVVVFYYQGTISSVK